MELINTNESFAVRKNIPAMIVVHAIATTSLQNAKKTTAFLPIYKSKDAGKKFLDEQLKN